MKRYAFTLVELLVVVAIIALLVGILTPVLGRARSQAKLTVCSSNLRGLGQGVATYSNLSRGQIPHGPAGDCMFGMPYKDLASTQVWVGVTPIPNDPERTYVGLGMLIRARCGTPEIFYCPADESEDFDEELPKIGTDQSAYSSYLYRQLDAVPAARKPAARFGDLGTNTCRRNDGTKTQVPVQALALDVSSYGDGEMQHLTHAGLKVNVLYQDTSVRSHDNWMIKETGAAPRTDPQETPADRLFSIYMDRAFGPGNYLEKRLDDILVRADVSYQQDPATAPQLMP